MTEDNVVGNVIRTPMRQLAAPNLEIAESHTSSRDQQD
jgi:hypothetical protein